MKKFLIMLLLPLFFILGQDDFDPEKDIKVTAFTDRSELKAGDDYRLIVAFDVPEGYHITHGDYFFVDTSGMPGTESAGKIIKGKTVYKNDIVYKGDIHYLFEGVYQDKDQNTVIAGYQICYELGDEFCFMPVEKEIEVDMSGADPALFPGQTKEEENTAGDVFNAVFGGDEGDMTIEERLAGILEGSSTWTLLVFLIAFLGGILDSMTPCVYPIIPVVISYMGAKSENKKSAGFFLSLFFVVGLAITYSIVGLLASFLGGIFGVGDLAANPYVRIGIAVVFTVLALSMFGFWDMKLISSEKQTKWMQKGKESRGILGSIIIGMISGLVAAPCVGPVLAVLLMHVAAAGDVFYGWLLFIAFAFGLGLLFIILGTFSGAINALPKAGMWMVNIKKFFGVVMIGAALFFVSIVIPPHILYFLISVLTMMLAVYMGAFSKFEKGSGFFSLAGKAVSIFLVLVSVVYGLKSISNYTALPFGTSVTAELSPGTVNVDFIKTEDDTNVIEDAVGSIEGTDKMVMVDFWADWCPNCLELDKVTWNYPELVEFADKNFVSIKLDFSDKDSNFSQKYIRQYSEYGATNLPLILFINNKNEVVEKVQGLVEGERMLKKMKRIIKENK